MSEDLLVRHCSPTLAGMKTGNMFSAAYTDETELREDLRAFNRRFASKGLRIVPLRCRENRALLYVYRPKKLAEDLKSGEAQDILKENGYPESAGSCVSFLRRRLAENGEFPHEVGLFLGYPPEDVSGFIRNGAQACKCVGCWKVYGDEAKAKCTFAKYRKCTAVYCAQWAAGKSIERLTVAV
ncbi:MAG: DUF3793 family protein [Clostridia bacterium]|nr:DUF3793 family protein [Clostridia bacterium]